MDNNETNELNAIEQAIANDPVNYLNSQPDPRKWTLTTEQIARSSTISPYDYLSTIKEPEKYSWLGNELKGLWEGMQAPFQSIINNSRDEELVKELTYKTPNMNKDDAGRIYDDLMRTRSFVRTREDAETAQKIRNNFGYSLANGIGSMISLAFMGVITRDPYAIGAVTYGAAKADVKGQLVDKYIQEEGTSEGLSKEKTKMNDVATAYGIFAGATEMTIGVERLAAGALGRYTKLDALSRLARQQGKYGKAVAIRAAKEFGTTGAEEAGEEFVQSVGEDIAVQGFTEAFTDENFKKALTQAMYGGIIGGPAGMAFYTVGRKFTIDSIKKWNKENNIGLTDQQIVGAADEIIDKGTHQMVDEIATRAELQLHYGQAFETVKQKIKDVITGTGTTPWTVPQAEETETTTNLFKEAWPNHESTPRGSITKLNDKYKTTVSIVSALNGKNKGKYSVHVSDTNARTDTLTTEGKWGNLSQVDENGVAIPWSAQYFDTAEEAWNAAANMFETKQQAKTQAQLSEEKLDEYADAVAKTITLPMILQANKAKLPLSEFLDVVKMHVVQGVNGPTPILQLEPIEDIDQLKAMLAEQDAIIKEQTDAAKLGIAIEGAKENAQRRKAVLKYRIRELEAEQKIKNARTTRKREKADYITAKDLQPEQTATIDTATQAEAGQDYILIAGRRIPVEYQVVDLSEIQPSHIDGEVNPNYTNTELQNRASRGTTQDVADLREKATNITPERLLRAVTSAEGAPLVNAQGEVIAGNGRAEIIRYAYENPETAQKYRAALEDAGFKTEGIERPILVRRNTTMTPEEQIAAADISNISETSAFDEASQARRDSKYLEGSANAIEFAGKIPMSERRGMMQNNGKWNMRRVNDRYEAALLSWLCGNDTQLFEALVLDGKLTHKVMDVLTANGNLIYETATKYPDTQLREDLYHALAKMQVANKNNFLEITQQIEIDGRDVMVENVFVWSWLYPDNTTNRQFLRNYATKLQTNHEQVANGQDMFGDQVAPLSKKDAVLQALKTTDEEHAQLSAQQGKEYEPLFAPETGEIKNAELGAAIASYQNQFAPVANKDNGVLFKYGYTSGATYYNKPSTEFVLRGGEGQIVHGWGIYVQKDRIKNIRYYREKFARGKVFVRNMPKDIKSGKRELRRIIKDKYNNDVPVINENLTNEQNIDLYDAIWISLALPQIAQHAQTNQDKYSYYTIFQAIESALARNILGDSSFKDHLENDKKFYAELNMAENDKKIYGLEKKYEGFTAFLGGIIDSAADAYNVKVKDLTAAQIKNHLHEIADSDYTEDFLLRNEFLDKVFPNQEPEWYEALRDAMLNAIKGNDILAETGFDNSIFEGTEAEIIDFNTSALEYAVNAARGEQYNGLPIDELVERNEEYGGFIGIMALTKQAGYPDAWDIMLDISQSKMSLDDVDKSPAWDFIKNQSGARFNKLFAKIIEHAQKKYNSDKFTKAYPDKDVRSWAAISEAFRNPTKPIRELLEDYIIENVSIDEKDIPLFIEILQYPHNVKNTRGQQLAVDVPESAELLNEDIILADQPSADKIRVILEDLAPGGLLDTYIEKADENNLDLFRKVNNIKETDLHDWYESLFESFNEKTVEEINAPNAVHDHFKLLIDYLMANMKGDAFYVATMEMIPETAIVLKDGTPTGEEVDYDSLPERHLTVMGVEDIPPTLAKHTSLFLNENGIKGIQYEGGRDDEGYVIFSDEAIKTLQRMDDEQPMYYKKQGLKSIGVYDHELQSIILGKAWDEVTLVHEFHHRYLQKIWEIYQQAQAGTKTVTPEWMNDTLKLFEMLEIDPNQNKLTTVQQEKFAYMVEAYITGLGVENQDNLAFQGFLHWVPEKYTSIMSIGYLDENGVIQNPYLDEESIAFFNRWFASPTVPSLPSSPDIQRMINAANEDGEPVPSNQKVMNNREKEWGQDSEERNTADAQLWRAIGENNPSNIRAAMDGEKELMKAEASNNPDDRILPEKPKLRDKWFHARQPDARETAAEAARAYVNNNPEHARELAFADPETMAEYDAPVDQGMLIRAVMETVAKGSDEWYILDNNLAMVKSMSGSTLALSGDISHQAYLDAKREVEEARELKAAINYAGTSRGAIEKWQSDINKFIAARVGSIIATKPNSTEREVAIKAFLEEAKTKFSGNTTNAALNKYDFTGYATQDTGAFIKWAEKQIKEAAHAKIDTKEQAELMKASIAAQAALKGINSTEQKDGNFARAAQSGKDIRHWQFVKDKMKKAYIGRWGRFGLWADRLFGGYMPSAMLMSANTLFVANIPSTTINTGVVRQAVKIIGENNVDEQIQKDEIKRIRQVFNASGLNLAQMEKPTSPSLMHGEKYTNQEQAHWYNFTFDILGKEDNWFRIPTFVDALARIATRDAKGDKAKANQLFRQYSELGNKDEQAQIGRKLALAVANMAVFTQDGTIASALNHIRSIINNATRRLAGFEPGGFGLGNLLAPFLKTGANIVEMGLTSTFAPVRTAAMGIRKLQGKQIPDIDKIALATDWINLAITCVAIAVMAAISGDDEDWYEEPYQTGRRYDPDKPYDSIRFGNYWVKLDIFGPIEIPLRTAAMLVKNWEKKKLAAMGDGLYEALEEIPLVNQFVDNQMDYMQKHPEKYWPSFAYNQANKLVPAQVKSLTRAGSRAAGTELDVSKLGKTIERKFHRNYGLDGAQLTTNDLLNILTNRLKYKPQ